MFRPVSKFVPLMNNLSVRPNTIELKILHREYIELVPKLTTTVHEGAKMELKLAYRTITMTPMRPKRISRMRGVIEVNTTEMAAVMTGAQREAELGMMRAPTIMHREAAEMRVRKSTG